MGYETFHQFTLWKNNKLLADEKYSKQILEKFQSFSRDAKDILDEFWQSQDWIKWYDMTNEVKKLSKEFPDIVFEVACSGEGSGDLWSEFFKDGKTYSKGAVEWPKFNKEKLK